MRRQNITQLCVRLRAQVIKTCRSWSYSTEQLKFMTPNTILPPAVPASGRKLKEIHLMSILLQFCAGSDLPENRWRWYQSKRQDNSRWNVSSTYIWYIMDGLLGTRWAVVPWHGFPCYAGLTSDPPIGSESSASATSDRVGPVYSLPHSGMWHI